MMRALRASGAKKCSIKIVDAFSKNRTLLPNKEPTTMAVTIRAPCRRLAPATVVVHLERWAK